MTNPYVVTELLADLRDTGMLPTSDESYSTARLIAAMNREQRLYLSRLLVELGEGYQQTTSETTIVAGTTRYRIPTRAIVAGLTLVEIVGSDGSTVPLHEVPRARAFDENLIGVGADYYIEGYELVFLATPTAGGTLRFTYARRLNRIVSTEEVGEITAINTGTKAVTVDAAPSGFTSSVLYDLVQGQPHFDTLGASLAATVAGNILTFTDELPAELAVGDFVALAGETPVCQAPLELHDVLVQKAAVKVLKAKGDPKAGMAEADLAQMRDDAISLLKRRVKGQPELIQNFNAPGWGRWRSRGRFRRS